MAPHGSPDHAPPPAADHVPGTMDTRAQEKTFAGFIGMVKWGMIIAVLILIFMALVDG